jgi:murein DD-endopeptidase MepM/ murein hydrolase activator NlpD
MGARTFGAFAAGFAVGVLVLGAALWSTGGVRSSVLPPWLRAKVSAALPAPPANLTANAALPSAPVPPPEGAPVPPPAAAQGSAERASMEPPLHLTMPVADVNSSSIPDSFHDMRDGHQHEAVDIMAPRNTPVKAVAEGNVAKLFTSKEGGLTLYQFDNSGQYAFYYAHLDHYANGVKEGTLLHTGDVLGYVGTTGDAPANAPHLHFAVFKLGPEKKWWQGTALDPLPMFK